MPVKITHDPNQRLLHHSFKLRNTQYHRGEFAESIELRYKVSRSIAKQREREKEKESGGRCRGGRGGCGEHRVGRLHPDRMAEQSWPDRAAISTYLFVANSDRNNSESISAHMYHYCCCETQEHTDTW